MVGVCLKTLCSAGWLGLILNIACPLIIIMKTKDYAKGQLQAGFNAKITPETLMKNKK